MGAEETSAAVAAGWLCPAHGVSYGGKAWENRCAQCESDARKALREWQEDWQIYAEWQRQIPERFRTRTLASWTRTTRAQQVIGTAVDRYVDTLEEQYRTGDGLLMLGAPGLGKSHLLTAITAEAIAAGYRARYVVWPDVLDLVRAQFALQDRERRDILAGLKSTTFLAIDELGLRANASDFEHATLFSLVDHRYREQLPMLVAANATTQTFPDLVGERVADRLAECTATLVLTGKSQRGTAPRSTAPQLRPPPAELVTREHAAGRWTERTHTHGKD
jgi:DNA replication protein DnaC